MDLKSLLKKPFNNNLLIGTRWLIAGFIILSFLGFLDASYLAAKYYLGTPLNCSIFEGCETVTTSKYAVVFNVPLALIGALYYLFIFILSAMYFDFRNYKIIFVLSFFSIFGFLFSLWLVYLQIFVIEAICFYCVVSAAISTSLFILGLIFFKKFFNAKKWTIDKN
jgi:uncharacterized membrane protein